MQTFSKSPLFTMNNIHYLCSESIEIEFISDYQLEYSEPENISDNLPTEIQIRLENSEILIILLQSFLMRKSQTLQLS